MIKFVYFDVGGVALFDFSGTNKWEEMMLSVGISKNNFDRFDSFYGSLAGRVNMDLDMDSMMPEIEKKFGIKFNKDYSLLVDGFVKRFERNKYIDNAIKEINKPCKIGLLTNMYPGM